MPQSLSKIYIHLIYSTKNRDPVLTDEIRPELHQYLGGILNNHGGRPVEINTEPDHAHILLLLSRTLSISEVVGQVKQGSTTWLQEKAPRWRDFHWQNGYGAFSVSHSNVDSVRQYIRDQKEHHRGTTFQEEFRMFLHKHEEKWDERYVWD